MAAAPVGLERQETWACLQFPARGAARSLSNHRAPAAHLQLKKFDECTVSGAVETERWFVSRCYLAACACLPILLLLFQFGPLDFVIRMHYHGECHGFSKETSRTKRYECSPPILRVAYFMPMASLWHEKNNGVVGVGFRSSNRWRALTSPCPRT